MDDTLWRLFIEFKFKECYLERYCAYCKHWNDGNAIGCFLTSSASVAGWALWTHVPWLWSTIIVLSQIVQIIKPFLPYEKNMDALKYLIPELSSLVIELENTWRKTRYSSPDELSDLLRQYRNRYNRMEMKYLGTSIIPRIERVDQDATESSQLFFSTNYNTEWSGDHVSKAPIPTDTNANS